MSINPYESDELLGQYLLFHYGAADEVLPYAQGPHDALDFAVRVVSELVDADRLCEMPRALDLGCAVGRSSFELSRFCDEVIAMDRSASFIRAAQEIQESGKRDYHYLDEGAFFRSAVAKPPEGAHGERILFEVGDALELRDDIGTFDLLLLANLIDRVDNPRRCLEQLPVLARDGAQLIITSPYTWREEFTPRDHWLSRLDEEGQPVRSLEVLQSILGDAFDLIKTSDMPFLIREHARKFQWSVAQASCWRRREK